MLPRSWLQRATVHCVHGLQDGAISLAFRQVPARESEPFLLGFMLVCFWFSFLGGQAAETKEGYSYPREDQPSTRSLISK